MFLAKYREIGNITKAAEYAGCARSTHHKNWLQNPSYVEKFEEAKAAAIDNLEAEAHRRGVDGVVEPVYYQGEEVGGVRKYSDTLLIFLLKGANPSKYRERYDHRISGPDGGAVAVKFYLPENRRELEHGSGS